MLPQVSLAFLQLNLIVFGLTMLVFLERQSFSFFGIIKL